MNIKKSILKLAFVSLLLPTVFSAQTSTMTEAEKLEAKKKAEVEKASYAKPYDEAENAEQKIAELVKKAKKSPLLTEVFSLIDFRK